jgi:transcriptional regulator with XRE-family HTH domain
LAVAFELNTPAEIAQVIGSRARELRLQRNLTQVGLSKRASVSLPSIKRFEHSGKIAFDALIRIAIALDAITAFEDLFGPQEQRSLDEIIRKEKPRQRGRRG